MNITKQENMIEINITPTFYILLFQQWTDFFNNDRIRGIDIFQITYERDYRLDRHNVVLIILGFVVSFRKNVFSK